MKKIDKTIAHIKELERRLGEREAVNMCNIPKQQIFQSSTNCPQEDVFCPQEKIYLKINDLQQ